jgi:RNA polymerase sigma factor (TIGR02999 family)
MKEERPASLSFEEVLPLVYQELRRIASRYLQRERRNHTLEPTALVHEAYLQVARRGQTWQNRAHVLSFAARAMRSILIDHARRRRAEKRGRGVRKVTLRLVEQRGAGNEVDLLALDEALKRLAIEEPLKSQVVELRVFGGLTIEETAEALGISTGSVKRYWTSARAWLYRELHG